MDTNKTYFTSWHIVNQIGEGSFGKVYEIQREDFGNVYKAALKIITIPKTQSEINEVSAELETNEDVTAYFWGVVEDIVKEITLMSKLKGNSHIVSYEDHCVLPLEDRIGWEIQIRMELLTPLNAHLMAHPATQEDVIKMGIDICKALELCQTYKIIHRDIKPENIFVSETGDYKLGDFGIARTAERTTGASTKVGTVSYMAPEVYRGEKYNSSVDTYSLGLVMYRLLNGNRLPFLPLAPNPIFFQDRESATQKRLSGERLLPPSQASSILGEMILRACAPSVKDRYSSPTEMRMALERLSNTQCENNDVIVPFPASETSNDETVSIFSQQTNSEKSHTEYYRQPDAIRCPICCYVNPIDNEVCDCCKYDISLARKTLDDIVLYYGDEAVKYLGHFVRSDGTIMDNMMEEDDSRKATSSGTRDGDHGRILGLGGVGVLVLLAVITILSMAGGRGAFFWL